MNPQVLGTTAVLCHSRRLLREGLSRLLGDLGFEVIQVGAFKEIARAVEERRPALTLIECDLVERDRKQLRTLALSQPGRPVALLGPVQNNLGWVLEAGARGYLSIELSPEELGKALRLLIAGDFILSRDIGGEFSEALRPRKNVTSGTLTETERTVLCFIGAGRTNREIAQALVVTEHTVKTHVRHVLEKLELRNRQQAAAYAAVHGVSTELLANPPTVTRTAVAADGQRSHTSPGRGGPY